MGLRGQAARRLFRAVRPQGQSADVELGRARDHAHRRQAARRGRGRPAAAGRRRTGRRSWSRKNFDVIYSYNAAESYTLAIAILAQRLAGGPGIVTPWPTDDPGLSRAERRELQALLAKHGYDVGAPDGAIGAKTKSAIADFQGKNGLTVDGRASVKVLEALRR